MAIQLRTNKASALTYNEMDRNFSSFFYSASIDNGNMLKLWYTGSSTLNTAPGDDFGPARFVPIDLQPTTGAVPTLTVAGNPRAIQFRHSTNPILDADNGFLYTTSQQLGIGVTTPATNTKIHAAGTTALPATLRLESTTSGTSQHKRATVDFYRGSTFMGTIGKDNNNNNALYIKTYPGVSTDYTKPVPPGNLIINIGNTPTSGEWTPVGLGINRLAPQHALHVQGTGCITGKLAVGDVPTAAALNVFQTAQTGTSLGDFETIAKFGIIPGASVDSLKILSVRQLAGGNNWWSNGMRIQQDVDETYRAYIQFSGEGNLHGFSIGTGQSTSPHKPGDIGIQERLRIDSYGNVTINKPVANAKFDVNGDTIVTGSFTTTGNATVGLSLTTGTTVTVGTNLTVGATASIGHVPLNAESNPRILVQSQTQGSVGQVQYITGIVPKGAIMMWTASVAPSGWAICDGNNGNTIGGIVIPDLRERFVVGAGSSPDIITYNYDTFTMSSTGLPFRTGTGTATAVYPSGAPAYTGISVGGTFNKVNNTSAVSNGVFYNSINSGTGNPPGYTQYALYALTGPTPATSFFLVYHMEDKNYRLYKGSVPPNNTNISNFGIYPYFSPPQGSIATLSQVGEFVTYRPNFSSLIWTENTAGYAIGDKGGLVNVKLGVSELASHYHEVKAYAGVNTTVSPNNLNINSPVNGPAASDSGLTGGNMPHENRPPYYALAFIIYHGVV